MGKETVFFVKYEEMKKLISYRNNVIRINRQNGCRLSQVVNYIKGIILSLVSSLIVFVFVINVNLLLACTFVTKSFIATHCHVFKRVV